MATTKPKNAKQRGSANTAGPAGKSGAPRNEKPAAAHPARAPLGVKVVAGFCLACLAAILVLSFLYRIERPTLTVRTVREGAPQPPPGMGAMGADAGEGAGPMGAMGKAMGGSGQTPPAMAEMIEMMGALKEKPNDFDLLMRLGERFLTMEFPERAVIFFERAAKVRPDDPEMLNALGVSYFQSNQAERAKEQFERLLALDGSDYRAHYNLGVLLGRSLNDPAGAKAQFAAVLASPAAPPEIKDQARREMGQ
ncbi:MAG: tetratricopeptide repeat protein [Desulfovibrionaceae bacterium]|nr:tetratricopeptide repeat protein [Desulfovibrionaceae bacterium]MBF0514935.1 tetratricopeptide repeat protein [Desulfovibrionaceae bacterium]